MLQEVLLRIHRHRDELADADRVMAWVHRIARNAVIDHYRRRAARPERPAGGAEDLVERAGEPLDEPMKRRGENSPLACARSSTEVSPTASARRSC